MTLRALYPRVATFQCVSGPRGMVQLSPFNTGKINRVVALRATAFLCRCFRRRKCATMHVFVARGALLWRCRKLLRVRLARFVAVRTRRLAVFALQRISRPGQVISGAPFHLVETSRVVALRAVRRWTRRTKPAVVNILVARPAFGRRRDKAVDASRRVVTFVARDTFMRTGQRVPRLRVNSRSHS